VRGRLKFSLPRCAVINITGDGYRLRIERATGVPARLWNNLESRYQEHQARLAEVERL